MRKQSSGTAPRRARFPVAGRVLASVNYARMLHSRRGRSEEELIAFLLERLPDLWEKAYIAMTPHPTGICTIRNDPFVYMFDDYASVEATLRLPHDPRSEARLVVAFGRSRPRRDLRDDYRLKGWPGRDEKRFGKKWDKGHFIAHSIGGAVDQSEFNVFIQRRDLNRGWSAPGKRYRAMEEYCAEHPGTFCFSRPLYADASSKPARLEFGVLKAGALWVEVFDNQYPEKTRREEPGDRHSE
jgi:hypothetical protein